MDNKVTILLPQIISVELPKDKIDEPFVGIRHEHVEKLMNQAWQGVCDENGVLRLNPGFFCTKLDVGKYKIIHNIGYNNISLSVTLAKSPGSAHVVENHSTYFTVETAQNGDLTDLPFAFTLTKVISPSVL